MHDFFRSFEIRPWKLIEFIRFSYISFVFTVLSLWFHTSGKNRAMDPLGVTAAIVDAHSLPRWSFTPVPAYEIMTRPSNSRRTQNPFPVRQDLNAKVALWWVFIGFCGFCCVLARSLDNNVLTHAVQRTVLLFFNANLHADNLPKRGSWKGIFLKTENVVSDDLMTIKSWGIQILLKFPVLHH